MKISAKCSHNQIFILSVLDGIKLSGNEVLYSFHFVGYYNGFKVKLIQVNGNASEMLAKGEAYLVLLDQIKVCDGILSGRLLKYELVFG